MTNVNADELEKYDDYLPQIIHHLQSFPNETVDFNEPHLRRSLANIYPLFLFIYILLIIFGTTGNICMITHIVRGRLFQDPTCAFLMNIGVCNLLICLLVAPISLAILLIQNWIFGSFLCYFVPMLQDVPLHAAMLSLVFLAWDRYRLLMYPLRARIPPFIAVLAVWVLSVCVVLPHAVYVNYIDMEALFGSGQFAGVGICTVNLGGDIEDYIRGLFIALYFLPIAMMSYLYIKVSGKMKCHQAPVSMCVLQARDRHSTQDIWNSQESRLSTSMCMAESNETSRHNSYSGHDPHQLPSFLVPGSHHHHGLGGGANSSARSPTSSLASAFQQQHQRTSLVPSVMMDNGGIVHDVDIAREKRNQHYQALIAMIFSLCLCPLMILRLMKNMVLETYDNSGHFDITFITFVWIAFLPTVTTPALYAMWKMDRKTSDRLKGCFQLSGRSRRGGRSGQHLTPILYSSHARTAHRLSLQPAIPPPSPNPGGRHGPLEDVGTPILSRSAQDRSRPHTLVIPD
ncbi:unnamed protein product [Meganyctiphanes norvegica]|uniref:G-protein coupled receptors family 1 profile domain-containing protein n=1 Tax=Meganyctiphanes norvegica TaxID=48144 RepID=A0AAV2PYQ3_MEGNR